MVLFVLFNQCTEEVAQMRAAGHGLLHMQGLPVAIVLAAVAFLAQVAPDVLDGDILCAFEQTVGQLRPTVR